MPATQDPMVAAGPDPDGAIGAALLTWFSAGQRDLPWRRSYTPYEVWISETMLQQTQVATMLPYYERWLQRFPDLNALADADEDELLKAWEGLGYYARARNLGKTARLLRDQFGGRFPDDRRALLALPGIGPYTAGAILSLAFNRPEPAVDGNVKRVLARLFDLDLALDSAAGRRSLERLAAALIPEGQARFFNQALMELGALLCLPRRPACGRCPLARCCRALAADRVAQRPVRAPRRAAQSLAVVVGVLQCGGKVLIQKRASNGLMAGLWEFPGGKIEPGETAEAALVREFMEELALKVTVGRPLASVRHAYTRFRVQLRSFWCRLEFPRQTPVSAAGLEYRWVAPADLERYPFPAANKRLIDKICSSAEAWSSGAAPAGDDGKGVGLKTGPGGQGAAPARNRIPCPR